MYLFRYHVSAGWANEASRQFPGQLSYFVLGALLRVNTTALHHLAKILLVSALLFVITHTTPLRIWIEPFFYASLVVFLATGLRRHVPLGRYGDISYGVYLFHFPIIQTLVHLHAYDAHPYAGAALALGLTLAAAWLSWHLVEKRMLRRSGSPMAATVTQ